MSESHEYLRSVTVGGPPTDGATVRLVEYDPGWPGLFAAHEARIRQALGPRVLWIEHVGSTSVPGLAAKPILDVVLAVADPAEEDDYIPALEAAGFALRIREPAWHGHRLLRPADQTVNLHVFGEGCPEIERMTAFRDRLRARPEDRALYERTKRGLAARTWRYVQDYSDAKDDVVREIHRRIAADAAG